MLKGSFLLNKDILEYKELDSAIKKYFLALLNLLKEKGYEIVPVSFPYFDYLLPLYNVISSAEAATNLERYDGVRDGNRQEANDWKGGILKTRTVGFGPEVKRKIMMGNTVLINNEKYKFYDQTTKVRNVVKKETDRVFKEVDVLLSPTTPTVAHKHGLKKDVIDRYLADIFTFHSNITGIPSVSLPVFTHPAGLPFGIQISGCSFSEHQLLGFSKKISPLLEKVEI